MARPPLDPQERMHRILILVLSGLVYLALMVASNTMYFNP